MYDSSKDSLAHIEIVQNLFNRVIIPELQKRAELHDKSKLSSPEKETYDKYIPMLKPVKYGTKEYYEIRDKMAQEGTKHHYEVNRHHPEHFENSDISKMNLIDILEMFIDWYAASQRSDTGFEKGLKNNCERFHISDQLASIFENTYQDLFNQ